MNPTINKLLLPILIFNLGFSAVQTDEDWAANMFNPEINDVNLIPDFDDAYGVAFRDINNDGLPDIFVTRFRELNRLLLNRGVNQSFIDRTIRTGLGGNLRPHRLQNLELGASIADFNNDGFPDVLTVGWGETTTINQQVKGFDFKNVTNKVGIEHPLSGNIGIFSDINLDGNLDLLITNEHGTNHLYIQNKPESFSNVALDYGLTDNDISQGAAFADLNLDGYPDLYICNWFEPDILLINQNGTDFRKEQLFITHLTDSLNSNSVNFGDLDNDGDLEVLVTDRNAFTKLYRNDLDATSAKFNLTDVTESSDLINNYPAYSAVIADFNNDGLLDVFFTNIGPNQLFLNRDDLKFELIYEEPIAQSDFPDENYSTGAAVADFENDGDLDLFISNKDSYCKLIINPLATGSYLRFEIKGIYSNRDAIGAKIWLYEEAPNKLVGFREISSSSGYLSSSELIAHFGVKANRLYSARIIFPSGRTIEVNSLTPNQLVQVMEVDGAARLFVQSQKFVSSLIRQPTFVPTLLLIILLILLLSVFTFVAIRRYKWRSKQTSLFMIIILSILFVFWSSMQTRPIVELLGAQNLVIAAILIFTTGFMEKVRQVNNQRYEYRQVLHRFSEELIFIRSNTKLLKQLVIMIQSNLNTKFAGVIELTDGKAGKQYCVPERQLEIGLSKLSEEQARVLLANASVDRTMILEYFDDLPDEIDLLIPFKRQNKIYGFLILASNNGKIFKAEDITLLATIANQASLAIENNLFIEETKALTKSLTESKVEKRYVNELEKKNRNLEELYNELKETQAQLIQSEKMSSLGQLVAGVAHELNNPIGYLYANMKELQKYIKLLKQGETNKIEVKPEYLQDDITQVIKESIEGSERVKTIVENLRKFSRLDEAEFKYADIHEGLDSTIMLVKKELGDRIKLHRNYANIPPISCMPGQLNQVFLNLLLNAIQAIDGDGNIWITTSANENDVTIEFKDDGRGIPKKNIDKVFEPFYTTKPIGMGTGLGLSISYGIVSEHGGSIKVKSKKTTGTTFIIKLPYKPE